MTSTELLTLLHDYGVILSPRGDRLHIDAPTGVLTGELRQAIQMHQAQLLDLVELFEERASIMEYDGRLPREEAERLAWQCVLRDGLTPAEMLKATVRPGDRRA